MPTFVVPGKPIAQPRHRSTKSGHHYIPSDHPIHAFKEACRLFCPLKEKLSGKVIVSMVCYFPRPKRDKHLPDEPCEYTAKPDADNVYKAATDALTGLAWEDDCTVDIGCVRRFYHERGGKPRTVIKIEPGGTL